MAVAINLGRQRLRPEQGIGGTISYENMARKAGVWATRESLPTPPPQPETVIELPEFTDQQIQELAETAVAEEVELVEV